jgi:hypothetical protein
MFIKVIIIFVLMVNVITTRDRLRSMMKLVVVCGAIFAVLAIKSYVVGDFTVVEKANVGVVGLRISGVVGGFFGNPNDIAVSLDLLLPLAIALALTSRGVKRLFYFLCGAILIAGVIVTFSRGGFLGLLVMGAMLLWKAGRHKRVLAFLACAVIFGVFLAAMPSGYAGRVSSIFNISEDPTGSSQARRELLDRATNVAVHHPVIGVGMGNFHIYSIHEQVAHNSYLEIAAELGVAGLVCYVLFILAPFRPLRKLERETELQASPPGVGTNGNNGEIHYFAIAMQGVLLAYIVCSFFGSIEYQWFLYYPVAYAIALRRIYEAEQAASVVAVATSAASNGKPVQPRGVIWKSRGVWEREEEPRAE